MKGKNVLLEDEIMNQGYEERTRITELQKHANKKNSIFNYFGEN
jgi:hypothetical protein